MSTSTHEKPGDFIVNTTRTDKSLRFYFPLEALEELELQSRFQNGFLDYSLTVDIISYIYIKRFLFIFGWLETGGRMVSRGQTYRNPKEINSCTICFGFLQHKSHPETQKDPFLLRIFSLKLFDDVELRYCNSVQEFSVNASFFAAEIRHPNQRS